MNCKMNENVLNETTELEDKSNINKSEDMDINKEKTIELKWINVAKGICIIAVILGHMGQSNINNIVFAFHLTVFFILSGYTLKNNKLDNIYISKKFRRLMIPYFITSLFIIFADMLLNLITKHDYTIYSISSILANDLIRVFFASGSITTFGQILLPGRIGAIWFLPALFFSLILCKLIINKVEKYRYRFEIAIIIALIGIIMAKFIWLPFSIQSSMLACPFIIFGKYLRDRNILEKIRIKELAFFIIILVLGYISNKNNIYFVTSSMNDIIITPIIAIASSLFIIKISMFCEKSKILNYIGENSLYFLCIHLFLLECGYWFISKLYMLLGIDSKYYYTCIIHLIICVIGTIIINLLKKIYNSKPRTSIKPEKRNLTIDVVRTICIITMILGNGSINTTLRKFIFSFHMMAFIFISGYLYKNNNELLFKRILKEIKRLILPTLFFSVLYILKNNYDIAQGIKNIIFAMSFSKKIFININSIGPYYFVLLLVVVKILYILIERFVKKEKNDNIKVLKQTLYCLGFTLIGVILGKKGYWLPWSADIALFCLIFYHIGHLFNKYDLINELFKRKYVYFILTPIWVYMIYCGSMEIAIRKYDPFGLVILGSLCGILTIFIFANSISNRIGKIGNRIMQLIGSSTIYILVIHAVFNYIIIDYIDNLGLNKENIFNLIVSLTIQISLGTIINCIITMIKKRIAKKYISRCSYN